MPFVRRLLLPAAAAGALAVTGAGLAQAAPNPEVPGGSFTCENTTYTATYGGLRSSGPIDCEALTARVTPGVAQPGPAVSGSGIAGPATSPAPATPAEDTASGSSDDSGAAAQPVG